MGRHPSARIIFALPLTRRKGEVTLPPAFSLHLEHVGMHRFLVGTQHKYSFDPVNSLRPPFSSDPGTICSMRWRSTCDMGLAFADAVVEEINIHGVFANENEF